MRWRQFGSLKAVRKAVGFLLMLSALGGVARAGDTRGPEFHSPELDPGSMASALTLLSGGALLITARRRRAG